MDQPVYIEKANGADIPDIVAMIGELFSIEQDFTIDAGKQERGIRALLTDTERAAVFVARTVSNKAVGMLTAQILISTAEGGPVALLEDLFIASPYRRRGVAASLVSTLEQWCIEKNCTRIQLLADCDNTGALAFYERLGYIKTSLICRRKCFG